MEPAIKDKAPPGRFAMHAEMRTDCYVMLASLLTQQPSETLMSTLQNLRWNEAIPEKVKSALEALRDAAHDFTLGAVEDEFSKLFVGLGRGELVPYASWYRERRVQSAPLVSLRSDLIRLGIVRKADSHEQEDHAGALCEIMALVSQKEYQIPLAMQAGFFADHLGSWMTTFFNDLQRAKSAGFYRSVGLFGRSFLESEQEYLEHGASGGISDGSHPDRSYSTYRPYAEARLDPENKEEE
jgi:TorA maturation chaperone TorD